MTYPFMLFLGTSLWQATCHVSSNYLLARLFSSITLGSARECAILRWCLKTLKSQENVYD